MRQDDDIEQMRIMLALLESIEHSSEQSHRRLAAEIGIALGLTNAYLKRCVKKGWLKVRKAERRNYSYYLTASGFHEKMRLTRNFLTDSFAFFREAREACAAAFALLAERGCHRIVLYGVSELAEVASIFVAEADINIVAVVDPDTDRETFLGWPVVRTFEDVPAAFDAVVVTDLKNTRVNLENAITRLGADRVIAPSLIGAFRRSRSVPATKPASSDSNERVGRASTQGSKS